MMSMRRRLTAIECAASTWSAEDVPITTTICHRAKAYSGTPARSCAKLGEAPDYAPSEESMEERSVTCADNDLGGCLHAACSLSKSGQITAQPVALVCRTVG